MFWNALFFVTLSAWVFYSSCFLRHLHHAKRCQRKSQRILAQMNDHIALLRPGTNVNIDAHRTELDVMIAHHRSVTDQWDAALNASEELSKEAIFWATLMIVSVAGIAIW